MSRRRSLQARIDDYLAERRRQGFQLRSRDAFLAGFARFVEAKHHRGPLSAELMVEWVRAAKDGHGDAGTWARCWGRLRHFICYLQQFEPDTHVPEASLFGPEPGRVAPHIYTEDEIIGLLAAARTLGPSGSLRPYTYQTLFGLMASTGLRVSEAIHLRDADVDFQRGILTIRQTKFAKSRQLPIHPSTAKALARYRKQRERHLPTTTGMPFLVGSRGRRLGLPLGERQAHRVFTGLRDGLGWVNRGGHDAPRLHDLRHTFAVRRLVRWYADGAEVDQKMLALSTYMGHAEIFYTYWYLTAVPELMAIVAGRFEQFAKLPGDDDA
ncbi:MAG: tyrosine-type recombinase/integrase [Rhodocyclaceae bacterium]|nr:tyrosine-type recombinase/integrase [Rhodocyclaceae bacterium]MBX3670927.1 tyrosine-type recombinase/integrase [Rhodocyclaceae bacterium]